MDAERDAAREAAGGPRPGGHLANRRPGWELPALSLDLRLSSHAPLEAFSGRAPCPAWCAAAAAAAPPPPEPPPPAVAHTLAWPPIHACSVAAAARATCTAASAGGR
jgi:hypothetical protein